MYYVSYYMGQISVDGNFELQQTVSDKTCLLLSFNK